MPSLLNFYMKTISPIKNAHMRIIAIPIIISKYLYIFKFFFSDI